MKFVTTRTLPFVTAGLGFLAIVYVVCTAPIGFTVTATTPSIPVYEDVLGIFTILWLILAFLFLPAYGIIYAIKDFRRGSTKTSKTMSFLGVMLNVSIYALVGFGAVIMVLEG